MTSPTRSFSAAGVFGSTCETMTPATFCGSDWRRLVGNGGDGEAGEDVSLGAQGRGGRAAAGRGRRAGRRSARPRRHFGDLGGDGERLPLAQHFHLHRRADARAGDGIAQRPTASFIGCLLKLRMTSPATQAGALGGRAGRDLGDERALHVLEAELLGEARD